MCFTDCYLTRIDETDNRHIRFQTLLCLFSSVLELMPTTTVPYIIFDKMEYISALAIFTSEHLLYSATQRSFIQIFELKEIKADQYGETEINQFGHLILI